ncbi:PrsW family glutamic-type intramembrane protease [Parenemella sanctibonifatiensis]|uniref:PrsW family intramembrane metalloprotease n=1 Tax=Parenemella sanctibonifatiensis TaxID=2016505 RepID=A0A255EFW7_9ACTN|nr:PrsW family glutamic-type intramembrane protease [Parenemella sanctibonifatiensis]OYN89851.1 PrsW family intramembrane metalloprotease [Parenemella sanctibonifatiensis]
MECPRCHATMPEVSHFCHNCGQDVRTPDLARRKTFAVKPDEPVASFAIVSSIMPRGAGDRPQTYRVALLVALTAALLTAIFGALPFAVMLAAFSIPIVYIVYMYDVNLWEDEPIPVTALTFVLTGALTVAWTLAWLMLRNDAPVLPGIDGLSAGPTVQGFLVTALLVPIVGEAIRQVGPLILASRPEFDDLMDGLTFGVISGVAYACFETIVLHWPLVTGGFVGIQEPAQWATLMFLEGFVKPLIYGTASGIACAEFSGLGRGYDGFTPRYFRGLAEALLAVILYQGGVYLFAFLPYGRTFSVMVAVLWGMAILGVLILRIRNVLHHGLMEAALESAARRGGVGDGELEFCPRCEMPLVQGAVFCNACGSNTRTAVKPHRDKKAAPVAEAVGVNASPGAAESAPPSQQRDQDNPQDSTTEGGDR